MVKFRFRPDYENVPVVDSKFDTSILPGELFLVKADNKGIIFHITRESDIKREDGLKICNSLCGARCGSDFSTLCDEVDVCHDCLSWVNRSMDNAFYDENSERWYLPEPLKGNLS